MAESIQENDHIFTIGQDRIRYIVSSREVSRVTSTAPDAALQKDEQPGPAHDNPPSVTSLSLIITGLCNLRCPYCYTRGLADNNEGKIMSEVEYLKNPTYSSADKLNIDCVVKFSTVPVELPFTASANDIEPHGVAIYQALLAGDAGPIGDYVPPPEPIKPAATAPHVAPTCEATTG